MASTQTAGAAGPLGDLKISWGWMLALGIVMTVLGVIGLGMAYWLTIAAVLWFGVLAIVGGIVQLVDAFHYKGWRSVVWHVLIAVVYVVAGIVMIAMPVAAAFWLTVFIAAALVVSGIFRLIMAFQMRGAGPWGWVLVSAIISIALGVLIYMQVLPSGEAVDTPEEALAWVQEWGWVIGLFVAVELLVQGLTLISIAFAARRIGQLPDRTGGGAATTAA